MKKLILSIIIVLAGVTASYGQNLQGQNQSIRIDHTTPQIFLNGTYPAFRTRTDTMETKAAVRAWVDSIFNTIDGIEGFSGSFDDLSDKPTYYPTTFDSITYPEGSVVDIDDMLYDSEVFSTYAKPWEIINPLTDVVAKAFATPMVTSTTNNVTGTDGRMYLALYQVVEETLVTGARAIAAGTSAITYTTGNQYNGYVIYKDMGNDTAVLVDSTINDTVLFSKHNGALVTKEFTSTVTLTPGWYYIGTIANHAGGATANCSLTGWTSSFNTIQTLYGLGTTRKYRLYISSLEAPPASFKISTATNGTFTSDIILYYTP